MNKHTFSTSQTQNPGVYSLLFPASFSHRMLDFLFTTRAAPLPKGQIVLTPPFTPSFLGFSRSFVGNGGLPGKDGFRALSDLWREFLLWDKDWRTASTPRWQGDSCTCNFLALFSWIESRSCCQSITSSLFKREKESLGFRITESYNGKSRRETYPPPPSRTPQYGMRDIWALAKPTILGSFKTAVNCGHSRRGGGGV